MKASFIDKVRIYSKHIVSFELKQNADAPEEGATVGLKLSIEAGNASISTLEAGAYYDCLVTLGAAMFDFDDVDTSQEYDPDANTSLFSCTATIKLVLEVASELKPPKGKLIAKEYTKELISLVYDDLRILIDENISRSAFQGFRMPIDFRVIASEDGASEEVLPQQKKVAKKKAPSKKRKR